MNKFITILLVSVLICACKSPEARRPISASSGSFIDQSVERNIKLNEREHADIEKLMASNPETDYIASESGFWYYYNNKVADSLKTPDFGDLVSFDYNVKALNGQTIYTQAEIETQDYIMDKQELFTGLREGLKLMRTGETVTFLFPSQKAYGYYGDEHKIGTNIPLICEVTIHSIKNSESN